MECNRRIIPNQLTIFTLQTPGQFPRCSLLGGSFPDYGVPLGRVASNPHQFQFTNSRAPKSVSVRLTDRADRPFRSPLQVA